MTDDNSWKTFFDQHAPEYMDNCFVTNTDFEVDFIEEELKLSSGAAILDVGCGTGRHSLELARRGYRVTGIDLSARMLEEAPEDIYVREKGFLSTELKLMLEKSGFQLENIWGGTAGNWKRERPRLNEMELMAVSQKLK